MKVYVTKYALTKGIVETEANGNPCNNGYLNVKWGGYYGNIDVSRRFWHEDRAPPWPCRRDADSEDRQPEEADRKALGAQVGGGVDGRRRQDS